MATPFRPIPITIGGAPDLRDIVGRDEQTKRVVRFLERDGDEPETPDSWAWTAARALDGDPESLLRLSPELRQIVQPPLDREAGR